MAAVTLGLHYESTSNSTSYTTGAFTPAAGDLLVAIVSTVEGQDVGSVSDSQGHDYTRILSASNTSSPYNRVSAFVCDALAAGSSTTLTFDCPGDAASGIHIDILRVSGMSRVGSNAVRQSASEVNQSSGSTPNPAFSAAALTGNPTIGAVSNGSDPAGLTNPTSWTELSDAGHGSPSHGLETVSRNSGFTGTTITWGGTSGSAYADISLELDASSFIPQFIHHYRQQGMM